MKKLMYTAGLIVTAALIVVTATGIPLHAQVSAELKKSLTINFSAEKSFAKLDITPPTIEKPEWYKKQLAAL